MKAIAKIKSSRGLNLIDVPEPSIQPGHVKLKVHYASVCGTDLHIYNWDEWSSQRIKPPRIIGHEFCGEIIEVGEGVDASRIGEFVATESRISCSTCFQCKNGQAHVCTNLVILGVDTDGGFAPYSVIPSQNARVTPKSIPSDVASMQDAIGNAVHTVMYQDVKDKTVLIAGLGPIGIMCVAICETLGAKKIYATEVSEYRSDLARKFGQVEIINPLKIDATEAMQQFEPLGVDCSFEMAGRPESVQLSIDATRPGGFVGVLGITANQMIPVNMNSIVMKGLEVQGVSGRKQWETWDQMHDLFTNKGLNLSELVTHQFHFSEFEQAMQILTEGNAGKIVLHFND